MLGRIGRRGENCGRRMHRAFSYQMSYYFTKGTRILKEDCWSLFLHRTGVRGSKSWIVYNGGSREPLRWVRPDLGLVQLKFHEATASTEGAGCTYSS